MQKEYTSNMESNVNYTLVGAFVIFLTGLIILGIIWLSSGFYSDEKFSIYEVNMQESVSGLSQDAAVEYNGVNVGQVTSIKLDRKNPRVVEVLLKIKSDTPVTLGTKAKLDIRSLSGQAYILLEDKGTNMTPLKALPGQEYPVIRTTPSLFVRLDTTLTQLSTSFSQLTTSVRSLLDDENLHSFKLLLDSSQSAAQLLQTQTIPAFNQALINLDNITHSLYEVSDEIKQNPAIIIRGKAAGALGPGEK